MSEMSWASLAPLLDNRRCVDSVVAGISPSIVIRASSRRYWTDFPERDEEYAIVKDNLPVGEEQIDNT